jgi:hypothetical protein
MRKQGHNPFTALFWAFKGKPLLPALAWVDTNILSNWGITLNWF